MAKKQEKYKYAQNNTTHMKIYHYKEYLIEQLKTKNPTQIAIENNVTPKTIQNLIWKLKLTNHPKNFWSKKEINLLIKNYPDNPKVYKLFPNRTIFSINHKASRLVIKRMQKTYKYTLNADFFNKWSQKVAYVFGLFCSDGNVSKDGTYCGFHIHKKDTEILELIKKAMKSNHAIEIRGKYAYFRIYNKKIAQGLIRLGCIPRKSLTLKFPEIPDKYLKHFVRGYFDGDGSIHFNKPNVIKIKLIGTKEFLEVLQNNLYLKLNLQKHKIKKYRNISFFEYYGDNARTFCSWIYKEARGLFLKRKHDRFVNHMQLRGLGVKHEI